MKRRTGIEGDARCHYDAELLSARHDSIRHLNRKRECSAIRRRSRNDLCARVECQSRGKTAGHNGPRDNAKGISRSHYLRRIGNQCSNTRQRGCRDSHCSHLEHLLHEIPVLIGDSKHEREVSDRAGSTCNSCRCWTGLNERQSSWKLSAWHTKCPGSISAHCHRESLFQTAFRKREVSDADPVGNNLRASIRPCHVVSLKLIEGRESSGRYHVSERQSIWTQSGARLRGVDEHVRI